MKKLLTAILIMSMMLSLASCANMSKTGKGAAIGGALGGVVGGLISDDTATGAIMGAVIGGAAGAIIGNYMNDQAEEIQKDLDNATVERVGEGIRITFDSGLLFDVNESTIKGASGENLTDLARILKKYEDTEILLEGHTDATGTDAYNLRLSDERAQSVARFLAEWGVAQNRFVTMGYGESQPVASNDTELGRQQNRRVEVAIYANEKLKEDALERVRD